MPYELAKVVVGAASLLKAEEDKRLLHFTEEATLIIMGKESVSLMKMRFRRLTCAGPLKPGKGKRLCSLISAIRLPRIREHTGSCA